MGSPGHHSACGNRFIFDVHPAGLQFKRLIYAFKLAFGKEKESAGADGDVSNFKALMTTLAGTIGNGNIAGVATAITVGGPGLCFGCGSSVF